MAIKIYNTMTGKKKIFRPINKNKVNLFVCGPTVYDFAHLGHAKTYVQFDVIVRYLRHRGYKVFYLQNITDLDDKIINRARKENKKPEEIAKRFEKAYFEDMKALDIKSITQYARATDYINAIIKQVKTLMKKGYAYKINDGIYYDLSRFKEYGKLSGRTSLEAEDAVSRIDESVGKKNSGDFCLWKFSKPDEPQYTSPFGYGRPGWHIEDTAITESFFGPQYDIHGGARDLIFPHHEAEIAQMEAISGKKPLVRYWMHTGFLNVEGKKMAKSLRNFITIRDALKKWGKPVLRFFFISTHYRSPIDFSENAMKQAENSLERLLNFLEDVKNKNDNKKSLEIVKNAENNFYKAMDDDFNTPKALAVIFDMIIKINKVGGGKKAYELLMKINKIFDVFEIKRKGIDKHILKLIKEREIARNKGDYKKADAIRAELRKKGIVLEDTKEGTKIRIC
jgi:cysteinyl-tRNA synthetase